MTDQDKQLLADCIRSGQVPQEDVPKIMAEKLGFATWYRAKYLAAAMLLILSPLSARAGQFDYILGFASFAAAKADAQAAAGHFNIDADDWAADHAMQVTVTRISTGNTVAGYFVLISMDRRVPALLNHSALRVALDRSKCNARQVGCVMRSTVGTAVLQDLTISPVYAGSDFPWGGLN